MPKITFENNTNGLSVEFSTETPMQFLSDFDGNSAGSNAITYAPLGLNGQKLIRTSLSARTITATVHVGGVEEGKYSRAAARKRWEEIQRVLVPGDVGRLVWTDGTVSRFIDCRTEATPKTSEVLPFMLSASFAFVADSPLWFDVEEQVVTFESSGPMEVQNDCGVAVPFVYEVETGSSSAGPWLLIVPYNGFSPFALALFEDVPSNSRCIIDTSTCTVKLYEGGSSDYVLSNHLLSVDSSFGSLQPGKNVMYCTWSSGCTARVRWRRAYMGVG